MPSKITKQDYETLAAFRYALRTFLRFSEAAAEGVGLSPQQHQALLAIMGFPGRDTVTITELAERLQIRHHSAVGLVNRLSNQGLIERRHHLGDKRQVYVALTPHGIDTLEQLAFSHRNELKRLKPQLYSLLTQLELKEGEG